MIKANEEIDVLKLLRSERIIKVIGRENKEL